MNPNGLVSDELIYGIVGYSGTWMYRGYESGHYWFSKEFSLFSTPFTINEVIRLVFRK